MSKNMALIKKRKLDNGFTGEYWVAITKNLKHLNKTEISLLLYKDKEARLAGKTFVLEERIGLFDGCYLSGKEVYNIIKKIVSENNEELFADAEDDL
jgi:hypothetical protein